MKNKVLLIIFSAFILTGCSFIFPNRNSSNETSSVNSASSASQTSSSSSSNSSSSSSSSSSESSKEESSDISSESSSYEESSSESSSEPLKVYKTFDFTKAGISAGSDLANTGPNNSLKSYMNSGTTYVSSISASKCFYQPIGQTGNDTICIGTASAGGSITFNFTCEITKISFTIQAYHKWNDYGKVWSLDPDSQVTVEGHLYEIGSDDTSLMPDPITESLDIDHKQSITFSNSEGKQRVYLNTLTIEYLEK